MKLSHCTKYSDPNASKTLEPGYSISVCTAFLLEDDGQPVKVKIKSSNSSDYVYENTFPDLFTWTMPLYGLLSGAHDIIAITVFDDEAGTGPPFQSISTLQIRARLPALRPGQGTDAPVEPNWNLRPSESSIHLNFGSLPGLSTTLTVTGVIFRSKRIS